MIVFVFAAVLVAVGHLVVAAQRPRLAIIVSAVLWVLYAVWEYNIANGTLCDKDCNIRVDLVFLLPILVVATLNARAAYLRPAGQHSVMSWLLGAAGLAVAAMVVHLFGYPAPAVAVGGVALALVGYAINVKYAGSRALKLQKK
jgi:hypothetical protein